MSGTPVLSSVDSRPVTIDDVFYARIGRMTVAFGSLDFFISYLAANMALLLGENPEELSPFTARKLEVIKVWAKKHERRLGKEATAELVNAAGEVKALLRRRQDAVHGLWVQEDADTPAWAMTLPKGRTLGRPSKTEAGTVDELTEAAIALQRRVGMAAVPVLKLS